MSARSVSPEVEIVHPKEGRARFSSALEGSERSVGARFERVGRLGHIR
jgi:hypothetical protein